MRDLASQIGGRQLNDVMIPGTHDSATCDITATSPIVPGSPAVFGLSPGTAVNAISMATTANLSLAQDLSILKQLQSGVRYLDLRIAAVSAQTYALATCHTLCSTPVYDVAPGGGTLSPGLLGQILAFATTAGSEQEILILDLQEFISLTAAQHHALIAALTGPGLGPLLISSLSAACTSTLNALWALPGRPRIIVLYNAPPDIALPTTLWDRTASIQSNWADTNDPKALVAFMNQQVNQKPSDKFFVLQGVLTPGIGDALTGAAVGGTSLMTLADQANPLVLNAINNPQLATDKKLNITIVDYIERSNVIDASLAIQQTGNAWTPRLVMAHRGAGADAGVYCNPFDGRSWTTDRSCATNEAATAPAVAAFGSNVYEVHQGANANRLYVSSSPTGLWSPSDPNGQDAPLKMSDGNYPTTIDGPALAVLNGWLYCLYRSSNSSSSSNGLLFFTATSNGTTWWPQQQATPASGSSLASSNAPALAADTARSVLHCVFKSSTDSNGNQLALNPPGSTTGASVLYWAYTTSVNGATLAWSRGIAVTGLANANTLYGPALAIVGSTLYCVYADPNNLLRWASRDVTAPDTAAWTDLGYVPYSGGQQAASARPGLTADGGTLYCAYRGMSPANQLYVTMGDGKAWPSLVQVPGPGSANGPGVTAVSWASP